MVVEPNPRGSTGRDQAFVRAIYQTWGITDYDDLIAAIDHVIGLGYADPERLGVYGYSYGGYMTNTVITRTQRFKAAASGAGHSMIVANYGHDIYQKWYNWELGVPWENRGEIRAAFSVDTGGTCHDADDSSSAVATTGTCRSSTPSFSTSRCAPEASTRSSWSTRIRITVDGARSSKRTTCTAYRQWFDKYLK